MGVVEHVDRGGYLVDGDPGTKVRLHVLQAQPGQVHRVLGQIPGNGEGVDVLETGEPQLHAHELEHRVAFTSKYLNQQELGVLVGHNPCTGQMDARPQGWRIGGKGRLETWEAKTSRGDQGEGQRERSGDGGILSQERMRERERIQENLRKRQWERGKR